MDCKGRITALIHNISQASVEPFLFLLWFGFQVRHVTFQSLLINRACRNTFNYTEEICNNLDKHKAEQEDSVRVGSNIYVGCVLLSTVPALIVSVFVGPWSDKYGRKLPLIIANCGVLAEFIADAIVSTKSDVHPIIFLGTSLLSGLTGGILICLSQIYSYLSDVTTDKTRPTRFAILECFFILSTPIGTLIGGLIYDAGGYKAPMIMGSCGVACSLCWAIFWLKETKPKDPNITNTEIFKDLFQTNNLKDSLKTCLQPRPGNLRMQIWLLVVISCSIMMIDVGSHGIGYVYATVTFKWGVSEYANATTFFYFFNAFATVVVVRTLSKKFMLHEAAMGLIGVLSLMAKMVVMSVSFKPALMYYAWFCGTLQACGEVAFRSRMSKLVGKQELGRVFSLLATCEALMPVLGTLIMTTIYNASLTFYPGLPYAIAALLLIPSAVIFGWMTTLPTMSFVQYEEEQNRKAVKEMVEFSEFI